MASARRAPPQQLAFINGPSRSAGKARAPGTMTSDSVAEQAAPASTACQKPEFAQFHRLNDAYRAKFRIPFIVCARRHTKDSILRQFRARLQNDPATETKAALSENLPHCRAAARSAGRGRRSARGTLGACPTHVLDTAAAHLRPA